MKEEIIVSWDIADGGKEWCVLFWKCKPDGTKECFQKIDKNSDDGETTERQGGSA